MKTPDNSRMNTMNNEENIINSNLMFKRNRLYKKPKKQNLIRNIFPLVYKNKNKIQEEYEMLNINNNNNFNKTNFHFSSFKDLIKDKDNKNKFNINESLSNSKKILFTKTPINNRNCENHLLKDNDFFRASKLNHINKYNDYYKFLNDSSKQKIMNKDLQYRENNIISNSKKEVNCLTIHFDYKKPFMKTGYNNFNCIDDLWIRYNNVHNKTADNKYLIKRNKNELKNILKNNNKEKNSKNLYVGKYYNTYYNSCNKKIDLCKESEGKNNNLSPKEEKGEIFRYMEKGKKKIKYHVKSSLLTGNKINGLFYGLYKPNRKENNNDDIMDFIREKK